MIEVSVIIPTRNNPSGVRKVLEALEEQTVLLDSFEVLVVDNGSEQKLYRKTERACEAATLEVKVLQRNDVASSYAARNKALEVAKGQILAFTDSDCAPEPQWIEQGVESLKRADLVSGRVEFTYTGSAPSAAEFLDSCLHMQTRKLAEEEHSGVTANLFVNAACFKKVGTFDEAVASGGDVLWTRKATGQGYELIYGTDVVVRHPARNLFELMSKMARVGFGKTKLDREGGSSVPSVIKRSILFFRPPSFKQLDTLTIGKEMPSSVFRLRVWCVWWLVRSVSAVYRLKGALGGRPVNS